MAITATSLTSGGDNVSKTSYSTASITPSANKLILLWIASYSSNAPSSITGNGLTWVLVDSRLAAYGVALYRAMGASPTTGAITINYASSPTRLTWGVAEFSGVDTSGTNGSGAIVQSASNESHNTGALTVTLAAFGSASNATFGCFGSGSGMTEGSGFTAVNSGSTGGGGGDEVRSFGEFRSDNDTTVDITGSASYWEGGVAIEIKAAATSTSRTISISMKFTTSTKRLGIYKRVRSFAIQTVSSVKRNLTRFRQALSGGVQTDTVKRYGLYKKTLSSVGRVGDTLKRLVAFGRKCILSVRSTLSVARSRILPKTISSSMGSVSAVSRVASYLRNITTKIVSIFSLTSLGTMPRNASLVLGNAFQANRISYFVRRINSSVSGSYVVKRLRYLLRNLRLYLPTLAGDGKLLNEDGTGLLTESGDYIVIDTIYGLKRSVNYLRSILTIRSMVFILMGIVNRVRAIAYGIQTSMTPSRVVFFVRSMRQNILPALNVSRIGSYIRNIHLIDTLSFYIDRSRRVGVNMAFSIYTEILVSRSIFFIRLAELSGSISLIPSRIGSYIRSVSTKIQQRFAVFAFITYRRFVENTIEFYSTVSRSIAYKRAVQIIGFIEFSVSRVLNLLRSVTSIIRPFSVVSRVEAFLRAANTILKNAFQASRIQEFVRNAAFSITASDFVVRIASLLRNIGLSIQSSVVAAIPAMRKIFVYISNASIVSRGISYIRSAANTVSSSYLVRRIGNYLRTASSSIISGFAVVRTIIPYVTEVALGVVKTAFSSISGFLSKSGSMDKHETQTTPKDIYKL